VGHKREAPKIRRLLEDLGYEPNRRFNGLYGDKRLLFYDNHNGRQVDVFLDVFEMCHTINLKERLDLDPVTISLADLLFTKLQIVEINEKDIKDIIAILRDHDLLDRDGPEVINVEYLAELCAEDWCIHRTLTENLSKVEFFLEKWSLEDDVAKDVLGKLNRLQSFIEEKPKTLRWRMRAKIGDKLRWYEPVEDAVRARMGSPVEPDGLSKDPEG
jgi:hypothetical protein